MRARPPIKRYNKPETSGNLADRDENSATSKLQSGNNNGPDNNRPGVNNQSGNTNRSERRFTSGFREPYSNSRGVFSAIDLGTNNCRLLIARPIQNGFRVVDAFSRIVRLGAGLSETGMLSELAMDRTIEALKVCAHKIQKKRVTCMRHVATEALRVATNAPEFIARVRSEVGINLETISTAEEARLAVMGCQSLIDKGNRHALVFDIGGGSTELIWVRVQQGQPVEMCGWMSIPWGVVNLTETYGKASRDGCQKSYRQMVEEVTAHLSGFERAYGLNERLKDRKVQFLGTSGTVTTLASLHLKLERYDRDKIDGAWMRASDITHLSRKVAAMTDIERASQPCIGKERADLVVAGCAVLESLLTMWPVEQLRVADRGIREGILRGLMEDEMPIIRINPPPLLKTTPAFSNITSFSSSTNIKTQDKLLHRTGRKNCNE